MSLLTMLMNYEETARDAVVTIDWEFIPQNWTSFARLQPITLDASGICGNSKLALGRLPILKQISSL